MGISIIIDINGEAKIPHIDILEENIRRNSLFIIAHIPVVAGIVVYLLFNY